MHQILLDQDELQAQGHEPLSPSGPVPGLAADVTEKEPEAS